MLAYLLQGLSLGLSAAASPGPFQAFIIGKAVRNGWRRTLPAVLAPLISDGPIIALMVLLFTRMPAGILRGIQIAGALYVLYLAWRAYRSWRNYRPAEAPEGTGQTLGQAVIANFLSPGPYVFWSMLAGPLLVQGWGESPAHGIAFLAGFYGAMLGALVLLVVLFSAARGLGPRVNRALIGLSALALAAFGVYQLWQGLA
ncbi:MAG: LysE family transporter [Anaerolineae bacterium]